MRFYRVTREHVRSRSLPLALCKAIAPAFPLLDLAQERLQVSSSSSSSASAAAAAAASSPASPPCPAAATAPCCWSISSAAAAASRSTPPLLRTCCGARHTPMSCATGTHLPLLPYKTVTVRPQARGRAHALRGSTASSSHVFAAAADRRAVIQRPTSAQHVTITAAPIHVAQCSV